MPRPIPVDLILHALVESLLELPEDHLRDLARAISAHCIDPRHVADQWCDGAGVASSADWIRRRLDRTQDWFVGLHIISAETRAMEVTIARRLADVGLALLVTQDAEDRATASLLLDASRLVVGLERIQAGADNGTASTIANLREMRNAAVAENDLWHGWAKTVAGIPSSHNPHDETLRDAVEKRIIAAETASRPAHELLVASLRAELDEARDCARREVAWVPKDVAIRPTFKPGDRVVIARKTDSETCPWEDSDDNLIGRTGEVQYIDSDNDVRVIVDGDWFWFSSACLDPAPPDTRTMRKRLIDRGLDPAKVDEAPESIVRPASAFKVGDAVKFVRRVYGVGNTDNKPINPPLGWCGKVENVDSGDAKLPIYVRGTPFDGGCTEQWLPAEALDIITPTARKPCGGCEGTGQIYGSGGGPPCPYCNGTGVTPNA